MNSVDLLMVLVVAAGVYTGRNDSIVAALIKAFGVVCTIFITFHYYVRFANFLRSAFLGRDAECEFFAFSLIFTVVFLVFILISKGWAIIIKIQALEPIDRWGSMLLSVARGYFLCGMIVFALILANHRYASPKARMSVSFLLMGESTVEVYRKTHSALIERVFPGEKINSEVFKILSGKPAKKH